MFLTEIAYRHYNTGCNELAYQYMHIQYLYKQFQQKIIEHQVNGKSHKVAEQLDTAF